MPSNHLILCCRLLLWPSVFPSIGIFSNESVLHIRWPKYWSFSFSISPSNEYSGLISFSNTKANLKGKIGFPVGSDSKESTCNAEDPGLISGLGRCAGERNGNSLQYSCLENPMDRGAWWATVHRVAKSWTWLILYHLSHQRSTLLTSYPYNVIYHSLPHIWAETASYLCISINVSFREKYPNFSWLVVIQVKITFLSLLYN